MNRRFPVLVTFLSFLLLACCSSGMIVVADEPSLLPPTETPDETVSLPTSTGTIMPTGFAGEKLVPTSFSMPFNPVYSESVPLTDVQQILAILEVLRQLEFTGLTNPGWYLRYDLYGENNTLAGDELYYLVHVVDSNGHCQEQMAYFRKAGRVSPFIFIGQDGVTGIIDSTGETRIMQVDTSVCSLEDTRSLGGGSGGYYIFSSLLGSYQRTLELIDETQSAFGESRFNAWFAREGEKEVFIVHYAGTNVRQAVSTDPEIGQSVPIESILRWDAYDLASGRPLRSWEETTLSNGKITSSEVRYALDYYPELPEELRVALDQAITGLKALTKER